MSYTAPLSADWSSSKQAVIACVRRIPAHKVANFGLIGSYCGLSGQVVGWILSGMPQEEWDTCPWYRVVAKNGFISSLKLGEKGMIQRHLLESEGYHILGDCVDMQRHGLIHFEEDVHTSSVLDL